MINAGGCTNEKEAMASKSCVTETSGGSSNKKKKKKKREKRTTFCRGGINNYRSNITGFDMTTNSRKLIKLEIECMKNKGSVWEEE
jgi:hypothetical protein